MNLIALCCTKCGGPLNFKGALICTCPSCETPHALINSGSNLLQSVSFLPYVPTTGKMERSLRMQLVAKLREIEMLAVSSSDRFDENCIKIVNEEKAIFRETIFNSDDGDMYIGKITVTPVARKGIFKKMFDPYVSIEPICRLWVTSVMTNYNGYKVLAGHRIRISVLREEFEKDVNELSQMIIDWFGVVPEVDLDKI